MNATKPEKLHRYIVKCKTCKRVWAFDIGSRQHGGDPQGFCWKTVREMGGCCEQPRRTCKWVNGKLSTAHVCNDKCMASTGPACECSCAGKNHGKNHVVNLEA